MHKNNPLVSIIIPVHNGEKYLKEAIESVLNQTYKNWELIIVNDASSDSTVKIATKYARADKKIKLFNHRHKKYRSGALNTGISNARGQFISFLDADDIYYPDKTEKQIDFLLKNPKVDMVYGDMRVFDENGTKYISRAIEFKEDPKKILLDISEKEIVPGSPAYKLLGYKNKYQIIPGCSVMIRKKVFDHIMLDENLKTSQDYDLWFQIIGRDHKIAKLPIMAYQYRHHPDQTTHTKNIPVKKRTTSEESNNYIIKKLKSWDYFKIPGETKPKILLVPNVPDWAFDFEADQIIKNFSDKFDFTKKYHADLFTSENYSKYDRIFVFFWPGAKHFLDRLTAQEAKDKLIVGVFSYNSWENRKQEAKKVFARCRSVVVNDKNLFTIFSSKNHTTHYAKKWVDQKHFKPTKKTISTTDKLIVGWAGNPDHHGAGYKGYWNILLPVCERNKDWITLKAALKNSKHISYQKMPRFYNSIDVITCLSRGETGPNSLLEAGACGKPAVSVRVGVAEELIKDDLNGILIERNQKSLEEALKKLHKQKKLIKTMGQRSRQEILKNWTCEKNIKTYLEIFN